jgi:hypothetical protein
MGLLSPEMADRAIDQFEAGFNRPAPNGFDFFGLV